MILLLRRDGAAGQADELAELADRSLPLDETPVDELLDAILAADLVVLS